MSPTDLIAGVVYSWEELGRHFDFKPAYLSAAGGMPVGSSTDSLLLITHPNSLIAQSDSASSSDYARTRQRRPRVELQRVA